MLRCKKGSQNLKSPSTCSWRLLQLTANIMGPLDQQLFFGFNSCLEYDAVIYQRKKNEKICQCNGEKFQVINLGLLSTHFKRVIAKWKKNEASTYPCYIGNEIVTHL